MRPEVRRVRLPSLPRRVKSTHEWNLPASRADWLEECVAFRAPFMPHSCLHKYPQARDGAEHHSTRRGG